MAVKCRAKDGLAKIRTEARFRPYICERVNAGIARAKARGIKFGRPLTVDVPRNMWRGSGLQDTALANFVGEPLPGLELEIDC